ncbi:hypothetical protein D3C73_853740 [compost metagenome]
MANDIKKLQLFAFVFIYNDNVLVLQVINVVIKDLQAIKHKQALRTPGSEALGYREPALCKFGNEG